jgi:hypothetical protein
LLRITLDLLRNEYPDEGNLLYDGVHLAFSIFGSWASSDHLHREMASGVFWRSLMKDFDIMEWRTQQRKDRCRGALDVCMERTESFSLSQYYVGDISQERIWRVLTHEDVYALHQSISEYFSYQTR